MASLRSFIKQAPAPFLLVCSYADEDADAKRVKLGETRSKYRDAELACKRAVRVEALDADGNTLRVWEADDAQLQEAEAVVTKAASTPAMPAAQLNENVAMITQIARLLVEAGDAASNRQAEMFQSVINQQGQLMSLVFERLTQLEVAHQENLMARAEELEEQAAAEPDAAPTDPNAAMVAQLMPAIVGGMMNNMGGNKS